jgi:hypothetical protein
MKSRRTPGFRALIRKVPALDRAAARRISRAGQLLQPSKVLAAPFRRIFQSFFTMHCRVDTGFKRGLCPDEVASPAP